MRNIFLFVRRYFNFLAFLFLQVLCLYFISSYSKYHEAAFGNISNELTGRFNSRYYEITRYFSLNKTNEQLAGANEKLLNQSAANYEYNGLPPVLVTDSLGGDSVRRIRRFSFRGAQVISNSVALENNFLVLSAGYGDGLRKGMGILDPAKGVVGIITETSDQYSVVMSLLHRDSRISGKLLRGGETGTVTWDGKLPNRVILNNIPKSAKVVKGDTVITSGFSSSFPRGMLIGRVSEVSKEKSSSNFRIILHCFADFHSLDYVFAVDDRHREETDAILKKLEKQL